MSAGWEPAKCPRCHKMPMPEDTFHEGNEFMIPVTYYYCGGCGKTWTESHWDGDYED